MNKIIEDIRKAASGLGKVKLMEVCGGHTNTIVRYGIRDILPKNVELVSGPGCPVCVTSQKDIDSIIDIALSGVPVSTYGDMMRVPGSRMSMEEAKAEGADIEYVYSATEVKPERVFFGIGFETTTPMTAFLLDKSVRVYSSHKIMMPAMEMLISGKNKIDGFILPGHVSTITGSQEWKGLKAPGVISGFEERHVVQSVLDLLNLIKHGKTGALNDYKEAVTERGNEKAQELVSKNMKVIDTEWRGFGVIPKSGLDPKDDKLNAKIIFQDIVSKVKPKEDSGCICGEVVSGLKSPKECKLFGKACMPDSPKGACMVSKEGACQIEYSYGK